MKEKITKITSVITTIEEMRQEAITRMEILEVFKDSIAQFKENNKISKTENSTIGNIWLTKEETQQVNAIEKEQNILIYFCMVNNWEQGTMYSYLYVSNKKQEWELERQDALEREPLAYVYNGSDCDLGSIGISSLFGSILRKY